MEKIIEKTPEADSCPLLIKEILASALATRTQNEIVYRDRLRFSYADLSKRVAKLANALEKLGVKAGDTVAVMDWDSHRYLEAFFAVPMMGAILHTVNVRLSAEQLIYTINHAEDDVLLVNAEFLPLVEQILPRLTTVKKFVLLSDAESAPLSTVPFAGEYEALLAGCQDSYDFRSFDENARATTFYTTGTTGLPKGVYFSHRQIVLHTMGGLSALASAAGHGRFHRGDVYMPITPMFHVHAWGLPYIATMLGVKQVYPGRYEPPMLLNLLKNEKVTFSHCVPTILHMLLSSPAIKEVDLNGWKVIIGGSLLPKALCKAAMGLGIDIFAGYGMSETCPILTLAQLGPEMTGLGIDEEVAIRCKTGKPLPLVDLRIVDPEMRDTDSDAGATGEIVVRAPWLTQGYLKDPEGSKQLWAGGYLHTSDVASRDEKGYVQISDRIKDVIKTGGEWVSSLALEDIIAQHPSVGETAVIGRPDDKWGERPIALIVAKPGATVSEEEILAHVKDYASRGVISKFGVPEKILFVTAIEKTSVGKLDKKLLRQKYAQ